MTWTDSQKGGPMAWSKLVGVGCGRQGTKKNRVHSKRPLHSAFRGYGLKNRKETLGIIVLFVKLPMKIVSGVYIV